MTTPDTDPQWPTEEIEQRRNQLPLYVPPLPGISDISQDPHLLDEDHAARFGESWRLAVAARTAVAGTAAAMIAAAVALLGTTEHPPGSNHNAVTVEYNAKFDRIGDGPWCDMGISVEAGRSGNSVAVCGGAGRGFAYTIAHAEWFRGIGRWHAGLHGAQPGDVIFFNWAGRKSIGDIEHVGLVEHVNSDGTAITIECNISDACRREHRDSTYVVGYGRPNYTAQEDDMQPTDKIPLGQWMEKHWPADKGINDGTMEAQTTWASGYGHSRAAHEGVDQLKTMVADLQRTVAGLAATVADMDARTKAG